MILHCMQNSRCVCNGERASAPKKLDQKLKRSQVEAPMSAGCVEI